MDLNQLAIDVAKKEGKKEQVNIAQIKEIISVILPILAHLPPDELSRLLNRYR